MSAFLGRKDRHEGCRKLERIRCKNHWFVGAHLFINSPLSDYLSSFSSIPHTLEIQSGLPERDLILVLEVEWDKCVRLVSLPAYSSGSKNVSMEVFTQ